MDALEFQKLTIGFGDQIIVKDLNATIRLGEFIGVFGPNGAGKSSLFKAILGLLKPISGNILIFGKTPERGHEEIGYMPQLRHETQAFPLSGRSYLGATLKGSGWGMPLLSKEQHIQIDEVIRLVKLEEYVDRPLTQYSGGERQRLALAQALLGHPKILMLDEPLSSLDPGQKDKIVTLIHSIHEQLKLTVLFTAHNINPLLGIMDRVIYLTAGKAAIGTVDEVVNSETLSWLYDTPIEVVKSGGNILVLHKKSGVALNEAHHGNHRIL